MQGEHSMNLVRHTPVCALVALLLVACGEDEVDPLDCEVGDYLIPLSAAAEPAARVSFEADWGKAPSQMKVRVVRGHATSFGVAGCGRDQAGVEWELSAGWGSLPQEPSYPLAIELFDEARLENGERLGPDEPYFGGELLRCWHGGCVAVDEIAFHYRYSVIFSDNVSGSADIQELDRAQGHFVAEIRAKPGNPSPRPESRISFDIHWNPAEVPAPLGAGGAPAEGAGGQTGAGQSNTTL